MLSRATLIIEGDDTLRRPCQASEDKAGAGIKFPGMPLDLRYHPAGLLPALRLITKAGVEAEHLVRRSRYWALEQVSDLVLQNAIGRQLDRVADAFGFEELVDLWTGEGCVTPGNKGASPGNARPLARAPPASRRRYANSQVAGRTARHRRIG